jgi:hypothetical protein
MRGGGGIARRSVALSAAVVLFTLGGPRAAAAGEPEPQVLPGNVLGTAIADLDGDGIDELVRLTLDGRLMVDAWRLDRATWRPIDARPAPRLEPAPGQASGSPDPEPELYGLTRWQNGGRDEALLMTARFDRTSETGDLCCLSASRVRLEGERLVVEPMDLGGRTFESLYPIDLDADGTDELLTVVTRYTSYADVGRTVIELLAWDGSAWMTRWRDELTPPGSSVVTRHADGRSAAEVLFRRESDTHLARIVVRGGAVVEERASVAGLVGRDPWLTGTTGDEIVIVASDGIHVVRWPVGGEPSVHAHARMSTFPSVQVIGQGEDALLVVQGPDLPYGRTEPRVDVYDLALDRLGTIGFGDAVLTAWQRSGLGGMWTESGRPLYPYIGPIPGLGGYAAGGTLIRPDGSGGYNSTPMASLIGTAIMGIAGGGEWAVVGNGWGTSEGVLSLHIGFFGDRMGGRTVLVPVEQLLDPRPELAGSIALRGAVELAGDDGRTTLAAEGDGFTVIVTALPGTAVAVFEPVTRVHEVGDEPLEIPMRPSRGGDADLPFQTDLLITSPTGQAALHRLQGTFVRNPPELTVSATTDLLAPRATVRGRASPGAAVRIDGRAVQASAAGRFETAVEAPIWPRTVIVTATDPLGNETEQRLEVVGVVDYRGWPWLPITAIGTLGVGAIMVLRVPGRRPETSTADDDAAFEELDQPS